MLLQGLTLLFSYFFILLEQQISLLLFVLLSGSSELDIGLPMGQLLLNKAHNRSEAYVVVEDIILVVFFN